MPFTRITARGVTLLCFPPSDQALNGLAMQMLEGLDRPAPEQLETRLRRWYPRATVRRRHSLAGLTDAQAWYVYRDGRYSPYANEAWWEQPGAARTVFSDDGRYLDASPAALALLNVTEEELRASRTGDFTSPEAAGDVPWVVELMRRTGELHSTAVLVPRGGQQPQGVEFHLVRDADGPGRHVSWMRPIPMAAAVAEPEPDPTD